MEKQPLIKQAWLRVLIFVVTLLLVSILVVFAAGMVISKLNAGSSSKSPYNLAGNFMLIRFLLSSIASFIVVVFFRRILDKRSLTSLGFKWKQNASHGATGFFLAILLLGIGSSLLIANENLQWTGISFDANKLFLAAGFMIIIAFAEELVFRGYMLNNLLQSMNKWLALTLSALLFAMFHANNPGISVLAIVNIFLAGMLLGINYIYTKNLWFGILFHFAWNFYQGPVLGYKVSGIELQGLLGQELTGNIMLTGGNFGFEGSLLSALLSLLAVASLAWVYEIKIRKDILSLQS